MSHDSTKDTFEFLSSKFGAPHRNQNVRSRLKIHDKQKQGPNFNKPQLPYKLKHQVIVLPNVWPILIIYKCVFVQNWLRPKHLAFGVLGYEMGRYHVTGSRDERNSTGSNRISYCALIIVGATAY